MPRKGPVRKRPITPDPIYSNRLVTRFINRLMVDGKKSISERIFYTALDVVESRSGKRGIEVFDQAIKNVMPQVEVRPRRVGGSTYQVPVEVRADRKVALSIRWLIAAARKRSGKTMIERLSAEFLDAANGTGAAVRQREERHKMADANKAFSHYRW